MLPTPPLSKVFCYKIETDVLFSEFIFVVISDFLKTLTFQIGLLDIIGLHINIERTDQ